MVSQAAIEKATAQVNRIAEKLDKKTTKAGAYVRVDEDEIKERDPWGTKIQVSYSQGGLAEVVSVRSAGPDCEFHTSDDIVRECMTANLKGIGEGIKENIGETAAEAAKGAVKGTVDGVKESVRENLGFLKREAKDESSDEANEPEVD